MKKILHKLFGIVFVLAMVAGCFVPAGTAAAELTDGDYYADFFDEFGLEFDLEDLTGETEAEPEERYVSDREKVKEILRSNLRRTGMSLNEDQRIYDFFGKFSRTELDEIDSWIEEKEDEGDISIRVFVAEMDMDDEKYFLEECADALCDNGYAEEDLAIMLLNLDYNNRGVCIQGYGTCEEQVNDDRIEYILDDIIEWFSGDDYEYGVKLFATEAAYYAQSSDFGKYFKDNSLKAKLHRMPWPVIILLPAAVAFIGILLMKGSKGGKMTANGLTYIQDGISGLTANKDDYVRTSVSKTYSPQSSGSSGGRSGGGRSSGGGGRSGGGRSHSGGSRRF
ncbi:MAG: TPM domain-containing protein [Lachnospiraceae bacterium]|nr:TPM domain-containing protein [Lachnospiraceae bacterium]MBQ8548213.1 TPM domain-containing protein [Lachnospiraceae bacterium]